MLSSKDDAPLVGFARLLGLRNCACGRNLSSARIHRTAIPKELAAHCNIICLVLEEI